MNKTVENVDGCLLGVGVTLFLWDFQQLQKLKINEAITNQIFFKRELGIAWYLKWELLKLYTKSNYE